MRGFGPILAHPGAVPMTLAAFIGRFPMAMLGLAVTLLVVAETGSYAAAGAVAAALTLSGAVGGPVGARLADRHGQHRVIPPLICAHVMAVAALTLSVLAGAPIWLWLLLGGLAGLTGPNLGAMVRARWAGVVEGPRELTSAFALESTLDEVAFVLGPPLATALAVAVAPASAVVASMVLAGSGGLALAAQRGTAPVPTRGTRHGGSSVWRGTAFVLLAGVMLLMGAVFGALEVGTVAFAAERDVAVATGWLLGVFALGSGLTGLYLGANPGSWRLSRQILAGTGALAVAASILPVVDSPPVYGAVMFASGLGVSAVLIGVLATIERSVPRERLTEALAMAISGILVGSAAAVAAAGALIDRGGSGWGLAVGSAAAIGGLTATLVGGRALAAAEAPAAAG